MSDIKHKRVESIEFWWECPRCGYHTHKFGSTQMPEYYKGKHEPVCARAAELGLTPIFDIGYLSTPNTTIRGWRRKSDGAALELHIGRKRNVWVPCETLEEALGVGYSQLEWEHEGQKCTKRSTYKYSEVRFVLDDDWHHPIEVYEVPYDWDWRDPDAEIPWNTNENEEGQT